MATNKARHAAQAPATKRYATTRRARRRAKRRRERALIIMFCAFIGLFAALYVLLPRKDFSENEKRVLAKFPRVSAETIFDGSFESGFEDWLSDHVPFRDGLVGLNAAYTLASGRNGLSGVILGEGGRLFAAPEPLDEAAIERKCERINSFAQATGLPTTVMLIPESGYIQDDALPALHARYRDAELEKTVRGALNAEIDFLWPEARFRALAGEKLYYRTDHHLTSRGAFEAYGAFAEARGLAAPDPNAYTVETHEGFYGSMYSKSGLWFIAPDEVELWSSPAQSGATVSFDDREPSDSLFFPEHLNEMDKYPVFLDGNHALVTIENPNAAGGSLLILRDSFGHCFAPFAAGDFQKIVLVDLRYYRLPVSELAREMDIDQALVLYGADTFLTDTNFAWLK